LINNDVLRSVRYILAVNDARIVEIIKMSDFQEVSEADVISFLKKDDEAGFQECSDKIMAHFLDGLVIYKRGKDESRPTPPIELPMTNNIILKKLRVAFELQEGDMYDVMETAGIRVSKPELSALFRKYGHKNYRPCGDQFLRNFLKGLTICIQGETKAKS
jgi:uncharacterized protein YehS (DUF1456 family)